MLKASQELVEEGEAGFEQLGSGSYDHFFVYANV